jgi:hypothetical protein
MSKSSVLNLYDVIDQTKHYVQKVFSDRVVIDSSDLPIHIQGQSVNLFSNDGSEIVDVVGYLTNLNNVVESNMSSGGDSLLAEEQARIAADSALQANITAESSARVSAVNSEASARSAADATLQSNINAEVSAREAAVAAELSARSAADSTLQFNITAEASARASAISSVQASISAESSARDSAINGLQTVLSEDISLVQSNLNTEAATRLANDNTL